MSQDTSSSLWNILFVTWMIALISSLGSLFFSEIMLFPPCTLCWYQRICMYPLVVVLLAGLFPFDEKVVRYSLPIAAIGWLISIYHNLIAFGIIPESISPCSMGVSCATKYIEWLGFITIPRLSFVAFTIILILLFILHKRIKKNV